MFSGLVSAALVAGLLTITCACTAMDWVRRSWPRMLTGAFLGSLLFGAVAALSGEVVLIALGHAFGGLVGASLALWSAHPRTTGSLVKPAYAPAHRASRRRDYAALMAVSFYLWLLTAVVSVILLHGDPVVV